MTTTAISPVSACAALSAIPDKDARRCRHRFNNRMRCRLPASPSQSGLCPQHSRDSLSVPELPNDSTDLSADLLPELSEASPAVDVRQFLARLLVQLSKGRIGARRAAVLAFISSQLLHSNRAPRNLISSRCKPTSTRQILNATDGK